MAVIGAQAGADATAVAIGALQTIGITEVTTMAIMPVITTTTMIITGLTTMATGRMSVVVMAQQLAETAEMHLQVRVTGILEVVPIWLIWAVA